MKIIIIAFILNTICVINVVAQSFMTNSLAKVTLTTRGQGEINGAICDISRAYEVRMCSEDATFRLEKPMSFTNATLGHVLEIIISNATNHVWRYENQTDTIYIHPATNAISMQIIGPVAVTNMPLGNFFAGNQIKNMDIYLAYAISTDGPRMAWMSENITLEFDEAYVWEVLDMISAQLSSEKSWFIQKMEFTGRQCHVVKFF